MTNLRRFASAVAIGAAGAAVMTLSWWAVLVAVPGVALAFAVDGGD
ncbi:MAG TPA: hypothetical protein VFA42_07230 [Gaiellaceae bacterium]|nr:hypothetical protein [Gaiellaceae bacterium]